MRFADIQGNGSLLKALAGMIDSGRIPHALMLHENDGGGAVPIALAFLQNLYCRNRHDGDSCGECPQCNKLSKMIHSDVHTIFPVNAGTLSVQFLGEWRKLVLENPNFTEADLNQALGIEGKNTMIAVAESKQLLSDLSLSALEGGYRSVLVYLPEKMNPEAANRLLKIIEEPPAQTLFLLITHAPEKVLVTIRSRCQVLRVQPHTGDSAALKFEDNGLLADLMDALIGRRLSDALEIGEALAALPSRENAKAFCKFASERFRTVFLIQQGMESLAPQDEEARRWASAVKKTFPRKAMEVLDRTLVRIGRNVNLKILFTDLVDRLYINI